MPHPFDATLKELFAQSPADLRKPFSLPEIEPARTLNVDLSTISAATDVAIGFGDPVQEITDLNFQSGPDPNVAARLLLYNAALHLKYRVPVRSTLVLLRPKAETPRLDGKLTYTSGGNRVLFEYDVMRLWEEPIEPFLQGGIGLLPLAPLCQLPTETSLDQSLRGIVRAIDRRLATLPDHAEAVRLMTATFILTALRVENRNLSSLFEGVNIMHKVAWDEFIDEGRLRAYRRDLLAIGGRRLGAPSARTVKTLEAIDEPERLERMMDLILDVKSWKALLAIK